MGDGPGFACHRQLEILGDILMPPTVKQVIQGSHMVSGTRCPARSDQLKKYSESRAAAPKGRCPVGHRGEFPDVLRRHIKGLTCLILSLTRLI